MRCVSQAALWSLLTGPRLSKMDGALFRLRGLVAPGCHQLKVCEKQRMVLSPRLLTASGPEAPTTMGDPLPQAQALS